MTRNNEDTNLNPTAESQFESKKIEDDDLVIGNTNEGPSPSKKRNSSDKSPDFVANKSKMSSKFVQSNRYSSTITKKSSKIASANDSARSVDKNKSIQISEKSKNKTQISVKPSQKMAMKEKSGGK